MKIFFLTGSEKPVSFNSSEDSIFWPIKSTKKYPFLNSIRFISRSSINYKTTRRS
jgi:hypothetical protein